jgi:hypothetical protein
MPAPTMTPVGPLLGEVVAAGRECEARSLGVPSVRRVERCVLPSISRRVLARVERRATWEGARAVEVHRCLVAGVEARTGEREVGRSPHAPGRVPIRCQDDGGERASVGRVQVQGLNIDPVADRQHDIAPAGTQNRPRAIRCAPRSRQLARELGWTGRVESELASEQASVAHGGERRRAANHGVGRSLLRGAAEQRGGADEREDEQSPDHPGTLRWSRPANGRHDHP